METFINDYEEPTFKRVPSTFNKAEKTVSELFNQPRIKFYRRIITLRKLANQLFRIPQRLEIIRIPERKQYLGDLNFKEDLEQAGVLKDYLKPNLSKNIISEHRKFKNKTIITVKTDIQNRYLKRI